jgi:hypothetical protein
MIGPYERNVLRTFLSDTNEKKIGWNIPFKTFFVFIDNPR